MAPRRCDRPRRRSRRAGAHASRPPPDRCATSRRIGGGDERRQPAARASSDEQTTMPRAPDARRRAAAVCDVAIPTIRLDTTSGMTVMRIAFTKSVPTGSTIETTGRAEIGSVLLKQQADADAGGERDEHTGSKRHAPKLRAALARGRSERGA